MSKLPETMIDEVRMLPQGQLSRLEHKGAAESSGTIGIERYYLLDLLRGIAAIVVLIWHYQHFFYNGVTRPADFLRTSQPLYGILSPFYTYGWNAVQLFFVLSGFIFFSKYLAAVQEGRVSARSFFILRFSRLYPLHFATLLLVASLQLLATSILGGAIIYPKNDLYHFTLNLLFISHWGFQKGWSFNGPAWSISVEVLLYTIFFVMALCVRSTLTARLVAATTLAWIGFYLMFHSSGTGQHVGIGLLCFFIGGATALLLERALQAKVSPWHLACAASLSLPIGAILMYRQAMGSLYWLLFLYSVVYPSLILLLAATQHIRKNAGRALMLLGDISYALYMTHFPLQAGLIILIKTNMIAPDLYSPIFLLTFLALALIISIPIYYLFELPVQNSLRRHFLTGRFRNPEQKLLGKDIIA